MLERTSRLLVFAVVLDVAGSLIGFRSGLGLTCGFACRADVDRILGCLGGRLLGWFWCLGLILLCDFCCLLKIGYTTNRVRHEYLRLAYRLEGLGL